jgi:ABC-type uncharacterized transport system auxiliary subunit
MFKSTFRSLGLLCLLALLSACGLGGANVPETYFYRLPSITLPAQGQQFSHLVIRPVQASGLYHERAMLYAEQSQPLQLQRYHYHLWAEKPAQLIDRALYQGLYSNGIAEKVSRGLLQPEKAVYIDTRIEQFEQLILADGVQVQVALQFAVASTEHSDVSRIRTYTSEVTPAGKRMHDIAEAYGAAVKQIMQQLVADLLVKK